MKDFIQTIRNIFRIPELRDRILYTLMLLAVYRFGSFVILPGIDSGVLQAEFGSQGASGGGVLGLFNSFLGGAFARGSVFALGVMPYISASIVVTLMAAIVPSIQKLRNEGDSGQRKINLYTRYITIVITLFQASSYVVYLRSQYPTATGEMAQHLLFFTITSVAILSAGTMFLVWIGERITDNGIGNGTSLIIMIGIVAGFVPALINEARASLPLIFFIEIIALGLVTMAVIALTQATRKIAVTYARQITVDSRIQGQLMRGGGGNRSYIPLKVNSTGVMPIIFAQAIMFLPATLVGFLDTNFTAVSALADYTSILYNVVFAVLIVVFTYFYTAIAVNPNDIADQLKRQGGFIPGIKPGKDTADYIDNILSKITLPGSLFLALVAIFPAIASRLGASGNFAQFFGGTTILIMIGVVLDTLQQIESYLLNRHYDGLMKSGRIKGRQATGVITGQQ